MPTYVVKGWVEVEVYAEFEAKNLREAQRIVKATDGNGVPDAYDYQEGNWVSKVNVESVERKSGLGDK